MLPRSQARRRDAGRRGSAALAVVVALGLGALLYLPFLGASDLTYPNEPDVAAPVREMLDRGDWITPTHNGQAWVDYPPLVYWCALGSVHLLHRLDEFALRLPVALAAILLAAFTGAFAARRLGAVPGVLSALVLLTFPMYAYQATNVHPDMLFALALLAGLLLYLAAERRPGGRGWAVRAVAFLCFGVAILAKGPLGLLLPGLALVVWHLSLGQVRRALLLAPLALLSLAVAFPWYALLARDNGAGWVWDEFVAQNFARFETGAVRGHGRAWSYYLLRIWHGLGLWSIALPAALGWRFRERVWADPVRRLLLLWGALTVVFFTLAATKREVYLLPAYPAFALLIADVLAQARTLRVPWFAFRPEAALRWITALALLVAGVAVLLGAVGAFALPHLAGTLAGLTDRQRPVVASLVPFMLATALALPGVLIVLLRAYRSDRAALAWGGVAALHAVSWVLLFSLVQPRFMPLLSYKPHAQALAAQLAPGERLGFLAPERERERRRRAVFVYYTGHLLAIAKDPEELAAFLQGASGRLAVVEADLAQRLLDTDARFRGAERGRFQVGNNRWVVVGSAARENPGGGGPPIRPSPSRLLLGRNRGPCGTLAIVERSARPSRLPHLGRVQARSRASTEPRSAPSGQRDPRLHELQQVVSGAGQAPLALPLRQAHPRSGSCGRDAWPTDSTEVVGGRHHLSSAPAAAWQG